MRQKTVSGAFLFPQGHNHERGTGTATELKIKNFIIYVIMKNILIVQAQSDVKYEPSKLGEGFKEAKCRIFLRDATSKDEFVAVLHGNDAVKKFPVGEIVEAKLKARANRKFCDFYTQQLDVTSIKVMKREIKQKNMFKDFCPWDV